MKIAFHLNNTGQKNIDCTHVVESNPGIGGSEYLILATATLLNERKNDIDILLYVHENGIFPSALNYKVISDLEECVNNAIKDFVETMVVDYKMLDDAIVIRNKDKMKFVVWCHNFVPDKQLTFYSKMPNVLRLITVGREQMDLYRDHAAFEKSDYIYNGVSKHTIDRYKDKLPAFSDRAKNVIYIGSIQECKGFHFLAKAWKQVLKSHPDANLYVVGSGKLYNRNNELGEWGIAEKEYEGKFIPFLLENEKLLPSVHFMGVMGNEKFDLLSKCKVGVPNPSGDTETFGLTAIEMQAMGCVVTTIKCPGYLDTVFDKSALYSNTSMLGEYIIKMLGKNENQYDKTYEFITDNFTYDIVISEWEKLFNECIPLNLSLHNKDIIVNNNFRFKIRKEYLRIKKKKYKILVFLPSIESVLSKITGVLPRVKNKLREIIHV